MTECEWETYLTIDGKPVAGATDLDLQLLGQLIGKPLPSTLAGLLKHHQGQAPVDGVVSWGARSAPLNCVLLATAAAAAKGSYSIEAALGHVRALGHQTLLPFAGGGGQSWFCLDVAAWPAESPVVFVDGDTPAGEPGAVSVVSSSLGDFLRDLP